MGGEILELESERLLRIGREEGREEGRAEERETLTNAILDIKSGVSQDELNNKYDTETLEFAYRCIS